MSAMIDDLLPDLIALRRDLHAHPELAFEERRTSGIVAAALRDAGLEVHEGIGGTGVVGILRRGRSERMIGLRADMDALPIVEQGDRPHLSRFPGRHHGCGHDGHTAMLIGAARQLARATPAATSRNACSMVSCTAALKLRTVPVNSTAAGSTLCD